MRLTRGFAAYAWATLAVLLGVVLWGAYVRATGSGAGCGAHWPLCNGVVVPRAPGSATLIEFSHRLSSGVLLLMIVGLVVGAWRRYPKGHRVRTAALASLVLALVEALIGAGLVLFELVADNPSMARGYSMAAHLVNTFLFMGAVLFTAWWASGGPPVRVRGREGLAALFGLGLLGMLVLGTSGAIAALGDTLFPARSLSEALRQDLDPTAHVFLRLRLAHPAIAIGVAIYLGMLIGLTARLRATPLTRRAGRAVAGLLVTQIVAGFINVALLAPVWLQLVHLLLADLLWIALLLFAASALAVEEASAPRIGSAGDDDEPAAHRTAAEGRDPLARRP